MDLDGLGCVYAIREAFEAAKGGVLFIGSTEQILNYKTIGYVRKSNFFYEKPAD